MRLSGSVKLRCDLGSGWSDGGAAGLPGFLRPQADIGRFTVSELARLIAIPFYLDASISFHNSAEFVGALAQNALACQPRSDLLGLVCGIGHVLSS